MKVYVRQKGLPVQISTGTTSGGDANKSENARIKQNICMFLCPGCLNLSTYSVSLLRVGFQVDFTFAFHCWLLSLVFRVTK